MIKWQTVSPEVAASHPLFGVKDELFLFLLYKIVDPMVSLGLVLTAMSELAWVLKPAGSSEPKPLYDVVTDPVILPICAIELALCILSCLGAYSLARKKRSFIWYFWIHSALLLGGWLSGRYIMYCAAHAFVGGAVGMYFCGYNVFFRLPSVIIFGAYSLFSKRFRITLLRQARPNDPILGLPK